jgi:pyruvate dehydrogenase E2 component (dihydrolipoamide acetyltransferase)
MSTEVLVPPLGQTVDTLTLVSWYKQEGETVAQGEPLYAVETDKATLDVEAPASGILHRVKAAPGDTVKVLSAIGVIEVKVEAEAEETSTSTSTSTLTSTLTSVSRIFVSPRARRLAESAGVPLDQVKATGPEGAIIERDVRAYLDEVEVKAETEAKEDSTSTLTSASTSTAVSISPIARRIAEEAGVDWQAITGTGPRGQITREDVEEARQRIAADQRIGVAAPAGPSSIQQTASNLQPPTSNFQLPVSSSQPSTFNLRSSTSAQLPASTFDFQPETLPFTGIRALIAERMVAGHTRAAPVTLTAEADTTALVELRDKLTADGVAVSYNDLFLTVLAKALAEHPRLNASLDGDTVKLWPQMDIAVAVDTERGLLAPVIRGVDRKGLAQLAAETAALAARARDGKCAPDELTGSTFTLTNLGMLGIDAFTPIINLPECAILGVGRIKMQPAWIGDHVEPRQMVWLSLTFDHRLVDGGPAARFLQRVAQLAERPHLLMT